jgi:hypothetical protein
MGKSMYNFGKREKEKARQQKQKDKTAKRIMAKQQKVNLKTGTPDAESEIAEPGSVEENCEKEPSLGNHPQDSPSL